MTPREALIISAPSGAGKSTIVKALMSLHPDKFAFSVSATTRPKREGEVNGRDYHFWSVSLFQEEVKNERFVEWEEVYPGLYYGTLQSELDQIKREEKTCVFDVDVVGGQKLKRIFGERALSVMILPVSLETLFHTLLIRDKDKDPKATARRLAKAPWELTQAGQFDLVITNDGYSSHFVDTAVRRVMTELELAVAA